MKKTIWAFLLLSLLGITVACEKDSIEEDINNPGNEEENVPELVSTKKGACFTYKGPTWSSRISRLKAHWHYSWGNELKDNEPENVEYVPMFWGKKVIDERVAELKQLADEGKIKYLLGFNEPDGVEQANMTVDEAIALWPKLEEVGVPLGSPAAVGFNNEWMTEFMSKAEAKGLRIDFICIHSYGGNNVDAFMNKLKEVHELYNRPIWITEFALADWKAESIEDNKFTPGQVLTFMKAVLPQIDKLEYVERFSWFSGQTINKALWPSALFDAEDNLTPLGEWYANFEANDEIGLGNDEPVDTNPVEEDEANILVNATFESGEITPWGGFKNGVVGMSTTAPHTGNYSGRIESNDGALYQVFNVEAGKTYSISFWSKWKEAPSETFSMIIKDENTNPDGEKLKYHTFAMPTGLEWAESKTEFTCPEGVSKVRIVFYKPKADDTLPAFYLDDVVVKEKSAAN